MGIGSGPSGLSRLYPCTLKPRLRSGLFCPSPYRSGRSPYWLKNPAAPAVNRDPEQDWGRRTAIMRNLLGITAAAVIATMFVLPADARAKKPKRPAISQTQQVPSLDGRITGRMRTCGFDLLQYDRRGCPTDPTAIDAWVTVGDATSRGSRAYGECGNCSRSVSFVQGPPRSGYPGRRKC